MTVGIALAICVGITAYSQFFVRQTAEKCCPPRALLWRATRGLTNGSLVVDVKIQVALVVGFLIGICGDRPRPGADNLLAARVRIDL